MKKRENVLFLLYLPLTSTTKVRIERKEKEKKRGKNGKHPYFLLYHHLEMLKDAQKSAEHQKGKKRGRGEYRASISFSALHRRIGKGKVRRKANLKGGGEKRS